MIEVVVGLDTIVLLAIGTGIGLGIIICKLGQLIAKDW